MCPEDSLHMSDIIEWLVLTQVELARGCLNGGRAQKHLFIANLRRRRKNIPAWKLGIANDTPLV
jgi:hypothetical protein